MNPSTHLLLIEDDAAVARSLQDGLEREGYTVTWQVSGAQGVQYARSHNPHLIILDVRLPDGSGFDFCRQMRESGLRQPIIMLTVEHQETDKVLGLEMGAGDYVTKPFSLRELLSRIRAQLRRAVGNLLDNACKFTPEGGAINVTVRQSEGWAELCVADTGIGIPADDLPQLFSRFHRGRNVTAYPGSGLGLAIVKAIVASHGGQVTAENASPGARFCVRLPAWAT